MGSSVRHSSFDEEDYDAFSRRLQQNLQTLEDLLKRPGFGVGEPSLGAELELSLIDHRGHAKWINGKILKLADDPQLTLELNQYNLEYNLSHLPAKGAPFSAIAEEISSKLNLLNQLVAPFDARTVAIGILPTLNERDISVDAMSDFLRYRVLMESIKAMRNCPFEINIDGPEPLFMELNDLNAEGANTSFQVHLRVNPDQFADCYNAAQMATAPGLAISTNSPLFLGHRLWEETRVPLFKQAVETRRTSEINHHRTARTGLGSGWVNASALELFQRSVREFAILLPECSADNPDRDNPAPELFELRLHHGSIWHWNRAIYDPADSGHLRIEFRALPSGPSVIDMVASAAFLVGLTKALSKRMKKFVNLLEFSQVKTNFYRAAEMGLDAPILWPDEKGRLQQVIIQQLIENLIPLAAEGLAELDVSPQESGLMLGIIQNRLEKKMTGARWQLQKLYQLEKEMDRPQALHVMLDHYLEHSDSGNPVHLWSIK